MHARKRRRSRYALILAASVVAIPVLAAGVLAGEMVSGDKYRLPAEETLDDDLYVAGEEVYIDGNVNGDVIAAGNYIEVNGDISGDIIAAGMSVKIRGKIGDDARIAGLGVEISGPIGDDFFGAAGGGAGWPPSYGSPAAATPAPAGITLTGEGSVGGDMVAFIGALDLAGAVEGDLHAAGEQVVISGGTVAGNAELKGLDVTVTERSRVNGALTVWSQNEASIAEGVSDDVTVHPPEKPVAPMFNYVHWAIRTVLRVFGFVVLAWLLLAYAPRVLSVPAEAIAESPLATAVLGLVIAIPFTVVPLATIILLIATGAVYGLGPALALLLLILGFFFVLWFVSPLITGVWVARSLHRYDAGSQIGATVLVVAVIVLLARLPFIGFAVSALSFLFAFGGLLLSLKKTPPPSTEPLYVEPGTH